jgi:hypothetical protein
MSDDRRPEPNWRLLALILCVAIVMGALGLSLRWW